MPKKCILILLDGLGDRSYKILGSNTPLQSAHTPILDKLAADGANGLYHATFLGQALPSENAHFALFGYDLAEFPGRGALEAVGAGIDLTPNDVAILSHFTSLSEKSGELVLDQNKPNASLDEITMLTECISYFQKDNITISFHPTGGIRGILTLTGDVSPYITDSDPFIDGKTLIDIQPWHNFRNDKATLKSASTLRAYLISVYQQLNAHEVNIYRKNKGLPLLNGLTTQRAGRLKQVDPFVEKFGLCGLIMASGLVYWGLGSYLGMDIEKVKDTKDPKQDIEMRLRRAYTLLDKYDFIHVHTKTPDEAAHRKDPMLKKKVIEALDEGIGRGIRGFIDDPDVLLIVTADHSTPSAGPLIHSGETVPLIISGEGIRRDGVTRFDEISAAQGVLGNVRGKELIYLILNHLERSKLAGIMDTPFDQPYWPGNYQPFKL